MTVVWLGFLQANDVYRHNFKDTKLYQRNIEAIPIAQYDRMKADAFFMSPPCQPYTRQGKQMGSEDTRSKSFKYLMDMLPKMQHPPSYILIENVKGFEVSDTHQYLLGVLGSCGYTWQEFLLTPRQFGVPNSRLRYFLVAKKSPLAFRHPPTGTVLRHIPGDPHFESVEDYGGVGEDDADDTQLPGISVPKAIGEYVEVGGVPETYYVPRKIMLSKGALMDIVLPTDRRSCCFTKAYAHYVEGTGSVLQANLSQPYKEVFDSHLALVQARKDADRAFEPDCDEEMTQSGDRIMSLGVRYFTEREIARLHCLPETFNFPPSISTKVAYRLLGNSLNVLVARCLMDYLFDDRRSQVLP
eukprot:comp12827_c0_seq1/m.7987 comp12827_c0_seq1/g.7987  ORF comp12827_c0_seq1/g.7987 comp12827_c0_seq1/m.7987 type:complete len:356 (-) comp12827_c0_seq1:487-1554(-)